MTHSKSGSKDERDSNFDHGEPVVPAAEIKQNQHKKQGQYFIGGPAQRVKSHQNGGANEYPENNDNDGIIHRRNIQPRLDRNSVQEQRAGNINNNYYIILYFFYYKIGFIFL